MQRMPRFLLGLVVFLLVISTQPVLNAQAVDGNCPPDGCKLFLPLTHNAGKIVKVGMVTDTGGIQDRSFNWMSWQGVLDAKAELFVEGHYLVSNTQADYATNINTFVQQGYDLIITVGFLMQDATQEAALAHPNQKFTIVDANYDPVLTNVVGQIYASEQAAYLSGYLSAGMTQTGTVGTFGGMNIPPVTRFMNGYYQGVMRFNSDNDADVEVLGWDPVTRDGTFLGNFDSLEDGKTAAQAQMTQGADIIFPVAGPAGLGGAEAVQQHGDAWLIGVDTDWAISQPDYKDVILTSVMKNTAATNFDVIGQVKEGVFTGGDYAGTLANNGVTLGAIAAAVPQALLDQVAAVKNAIIAGTIVVMP